MFIVLLLSKKSTSARPFRSENPRAIYEHTSLTQFITKAKDLFYFPQRFIYFSERERADYMSRGEEQRKRERETQGDSHLSESTGPNGAQSHNPKIRNQESDCTPPVTPSLSGIHHLFCIFIVTLIRIAIWIPEMFFKLLALFSFF